MPLALQNQPLYMLKLLIVKKYQKKAIVKIVEEEFDLRPKSLINMLDLKRPIYLQTAAYGHFGRSDIHFLGKKLIKQQTYHNKIIIKEIKWKTTIK